MRTRSRPLIRARRRTGRQPTWDEPGCRRCRAAAPPGSSSRWTGPPRRTGRWSGPSARPPAARPSCWPSASSTHRTATRWTGIARVPRAHAGGRPRPPRGAGAPRRSPRPASSGRTRTAVLERPVFEALDRRHPRRRPGRRRRRRQAAAPPGGPPPADPPAGPWRLTGRDRSPRRTRTASRLGRAPYRRAVTPPDRRPPRTGDAPTPPQSRPVLAAAVRAAASGSQLEATLHDIVQAAVRHVDASYGALGVLTPGRPPAGPVRHRGHGRGRPRAHRPAARRGRASSVCWSAEPVAAAARRPRPSTRPPRASRRATRRCGPSSASRSGSATPSSATST